MDTSTNPNAKKVLIIEDDKEIYEMYRIKFENDGYKVRVAGNGETGLEQIKYYAPDIILLDLMMPLMNGQEVLRRMSETPEGRAARVIVLTNMGDETTATQVQQYHPADYIVKASMTPKEVSARIAKIIQETPPNNPAGRDL